MSRHVQYVAGDREDQRIRAADPSHQRSGGSIPPTDIDQLTRVVEAAGLVRGVDEVERARPHVPVPVPHLVRPHAQRRQVAAGVVREQVPHGVRGVRLQQTLRIEGVRGTSSAILSSGLASLYDPICFHLRDLACEHVTLLAPRPSRRQRRREDNQPERRGSQERDGGHLRATGAASSLVAAPAADRCSSARDLAETSGTGG